MRDSFTSAPPARARRFALLLSALIRPLARGAVVTLALGAASVTAPTASALTVVPMTPEMVLANSDMIVLGEVVGVSARWSGANESMIATDYSVRIERVLWDPSRLHGPVGEGGTVTLSFAGGEIDGKRVWVSDIPTCKLGDRAFFCLSRDNKGAISPLTGATAGLFRVAPAGADQRAGAAVLSATGAPVSRGFFALPDDPARAFTPEQFADEIARALPIAKADPALVYRAPRPGDEPTVRDASVAAPYTIPVTTPEHADPSVRGSWGAIEAPAAGAAGHGRSHEPPAPGASDAGSREYAELHQLHGAVERYRFLWGSPNAPSVFNIPPMYYGSSPWGLEFEYSCSDWNRYATLFRKYTTGQNTFGHQGRNDFAFTNSTDFYSAYGFSLGSSTVAIAVMYNSGGGNIQPGQKIYESDVIMNVAFSYTTSFTFAYSNPSVYYFSFVAIHETGHCFGREHQFTADPSAQYNSVMNYPPVGALLTEFYLPFVDDAGSIRAAYPSLSNTITDVGIHLFRTNGTGSSSGGVPVQWASQPSSAQKGSSISVSGYTIENLGTGTASVTVDWYLTPSRHSYTGAIYCNRSTYPDLATFSLYNASATVNVPSSTPTGTYYLAAALASDGFNGNQSAWSNASISVTAPPPPANDNSSNAQYFQGGVSFDLTNATPTPGSSSIACGGSNIPVGRDVWFFWVAPGAGSCKLITCGSVADTVLHIVDPYGQPAGCNDDGCSSGYGSFARFRTAPGGGYLIRVAAYSGGTGTGYMSAEFAGDPASQADFNPDGVIDSNDLTLLLLRYGTGVNPYAAGDITGDGWVDTSDLTRLLLVFGRVCP